jgi:hypothetical protein
MNARDQVATTEADALRWLTNRSRGRRGDSDLDYDPDFLDGIDEPRGAIGQRRT